MRAGVARPVRMPAKSTDAWWTALPILSTVSRRMSSIMGDGPATSCDQRTYRLPLEGAPDVARGHEVEHDDGQLVVHAEGDGRGVHDPEAAVEDLDVVDLGEPGRLGVGQG